MRKFSSLLALWLLFVFSTQSIAFAGTSKLNHFYDYHWSKPSDEGASLTTSQVVAMLRETDVVFFGELHNHPGVHLAQMQLFAALHANNPNLTLSLEQFERDTQPILDQYLDNQIGEEYLISEARAWDNYKSSYRPLIEYSRKHALPVIAANAPKQMVVCVGRSGLDVLTRYDEEKRQFVAKGHRYGRWALQAKISHVYGAGFSAQDAG